MAKGKKKNKSTIGIIVAVVLFLGLIGNFIEEPSKDVEKTSVTSVIAESSAFNEETTIEETTETQADTTQELTESETTEKSYNTVNYKVTTTDLPEFKGSPYVAVNNNIPGFTEDEITSAYFESYSPLDDYGRCTEAFACLGLETAPTEERGEIGYVKPSGWRTYKYDCVDGKYLYNRCHLIGFQLSGENANVRNLITGTRYMNVDGMLPFENMVDDYIEETGNHVMYRVTPIFVGDELVARGVQMEAYSVEDDGDGICFNVYCFNAQPGVTINYATGESELN